MTFFLYVDMNKKIQEKFKGLLQCAWEKVDNKKRMLF